MSDGSAVDLVIVGAGAAGLAAARAAGEAGLDYVVLEAMDRIGGRAHTDHTTFGVPWDRGCHWLHSADVNPLRELADDYGFHYLRESPPRHYHLGDRLRSGEEARAVRAAVDAVWDRVDRLAATGADVPVGSAIVGDHPFLAVWRTEIAAEWGVGADEVSTRDDAAYRDTDQNWPVPEGYGALVARHAAGIPVSLSTPVERIAWGGPRVRVSTPAGTIDAGAVVVTVSVKVIQDGLIAFDPPLPTWKQEAYGAIALGNANKVCFAIDGRHLGVDGHESLWVKVTEEQGMFFQLRPFGWDMANGYLAGPLGAELEAAGPEAMLAAGRAALVTAFGTDITEHITTERVLHLGVGTVDSRRLRGGPAGNLRQAARTRHTDRRPALFRRRSDIARLVFDLPRRPPDRDRRRGADRRRPRPGAGVGTAARA